MSHITATQLTRTYGAGDAAVTALHEVGFTIASGEFVAIMGESGAGKSTLLAVLGAMSAPNRGRLVVDDIDVYALNSEQRADFRREFLGFVFQRFHLVPYLTVLENVMLPLAVTDRRKIQKTQMAQDALDLVGIADLGHRLPGEISGGQCERVAIARAIVNAPPILLADEPTGNLDSRTSGQVMAQLTALNKRGTTIVMVTHSKDMAAYAHRCLTMADGRLAA